MQEYVIQIDFVDCPGLGYAIFKCTEENNIDKIAMEVLPKASMMIKFCCPSASQAHKLVSDLHAIAGVRAITFCDQMPYEERECELRTILNSVNEGIIAVDKMGIITHINAVACETLYCSAQEAIGLAAEELLLANSPLVETLRTGQAYKLQERRIDKQGQNIRFLMSSVPVRNGVGQVIGAVATIKDFHQVETMMVQVDKMRRLPSFAQIVHQSPKMAQTIAAARAVAKSSSTILLRGESGTGKELFATAIHTEGPRYSGPFIAINCTALPDTLLESELFGYEEASFTGAAKGGKKGLFEQANGGTLFLDEIGEISLQLQVKLLRTLQEGTIRRIGGTSEVRVDVRIIAATHCNLEEMLQKGTFRKDLYYRLNVIPLTIAPLRERKEDIPVLAQHLIRKICAKLSKQEVRLTPESVALLMAQDWPGNVRQLENTLERLINLIDTTEITGQHLLTWTDMENGKSNSKAIIETKSTLQIPLPENNQWPPLKELIGEIEKAIIRKVLDKYPSSRLAGQVLGVSNTTILNKMKIQRISQDEKNS